MNTYEIKLSGASADDGSIELDRLIDLACALKEIAAGALQIRLLGASFRKGRKTEQIARALRIKLSNLKPGSTVLELTCEPFKTNAVGVQGYVFDQQLIETLPDATPVSLVVDAFKEALEAKEEYTYLDKPLLKKLKSLEKVILAPEETITFSNRGSMPDFQLSKKDFKKIKVLDESTPEPQEIIVNGVIDELKFTKSRAGIVTSDGIISGVFSDDIDPEQISKYWGKEVSLSGRAYYQPGGKFSFLFIDRFFEPGERDKYFSRISKKETTEQQIQRQLSQRKHINRLGEIVGQWPGDESIEEILKGID